MSKVFFSTTTFIKIMQKHYFSTVLDCFKVMLFLIFLETFLQLYAKFKILYFFYFMRKLFRFCAKSYKKRDALRDSFKTNNEYVISYTFFELIDSFVNMTSKYTLLGDVNNDGKVNIDDATLVQKYLANTENLTEIQKALASLNGGCFTVVPALNIDTVTELQMYFADLYKSGTKHCSYGETYVDNFGNTFNTMITMYWEFTDDRYAYVDAKVKELELEGVI